MPRIARLIIAVLVTIILGGCAMGIEEAKYRAVMRSQSFEIRDYDSRVVAETVVDGDLEDAGNKAFNRLFGYISGKNRSRERIAMTAPVSQEPQSEKIAMTAPVGQQRVERGWAISFMMPTSYTMESLPEPEDPEVTLREIPACRMAAVRYSGVWSEKGYLRYKGNLEAWIRERDLTVVGEPVWARYNPPFTPWFLRRNEILIPVKKDKD